MLLVVDKMYAIDEGGYLVGCNAAAIFKDKNDKIVHVENFKGKCMSRYVREVPDFNYEYYISTALSKGGVFKIHVE